MPFAARPISTRSDVTEIYQNSTNILQKVAVSGMVGLLKQINNLSTYAAEIMVDLSKETEKTTERIVKCSKRLEELEKQTPLVEKMFVDNSPQYFCDHPYMDQEYARKDAAPGLLIRRDRSTIPVDRRRQEALPPPDFSSLDKFSVDNVPCNNKYSDPKFFLNEWLEAEKLRVQKEKEKRKQKREERKARQKSGNDRNNNKKVPSVEKKRYDKYGNLIIETEEPVQIQNINMEDSKNNNENKNKDINNIHVPNPPSTTAPIITTTNNAKQNEFKDSLPLENNQQTSSPLKPPPPKNDDTSSLLDKKRLSSNISQPPIPLQNSGGPSRPPPIPSQDQNQNQGGISRPPPIPSQDSGGPPRPPPVPKFFVPTTNNENTIEEKQNQQPQVPYHEQKRSYSNGIGNNEFLEINKENVSEEIVQNGSNNVIASQKTMAPLAFLDQLKNGNAQAALRPTHNVVRSAPKDPHSILLAQLQSGGAKSNLKKVDTNEIKKTETKSWLEEMITKTRPLYGDDDDVDEDSEGSWDDDD